MGLQVVGANDGMMGQGMMGPGMMGQGMMRQGMMPGNQEKMGAIAESRLVKYLRLN